MQEREEAREEEGLVEERADRLVLVPAGREVEGKRGDRTRASVACRSSVIGGVRLWCVRVGSELPAPVVAAVPEDPPNHMEGLEPEQRVAQGVLRVAKNRERTVLTTSARRERHHVQGHWRA